MKIKFLLSIPLLFIWIYIGASKNASAQSLKNGFSRTVEGRILVSTILPRLRIKFNKAFKFVGSQNFILYARSEIEQFFFVDADKQQRIKRMYIIQFEGYLLGINANYNYPAGLIILGADSYMANADVLSNISDSPQQNSQSDVARAASFLSDKGFRSSETITFQRLVRAVDQAKRNEIILLYVEDGNVFGAMHEEKIKQDLLKRATKNLKILN